MRALFRLRRKPGMLGVMLLLLWTTAAQTSDRDGDLIPDGSDPRPTVVDLPVVVATAISGTVGLDLKITETNTVTLETTFEQSEVQEYRRVYSRTFEQKNTKSFGTEASVGWDPSKLMSSFLGLTGKFGIGGKSDGSSTLTTKSVFEDTNTQRLENVRKLREVDETRVSYGDSAGYLGLTIEFENLSPYPIAITEVEYSLAVVDPEQGTAEMLAERVPLNAVITVGGKLLAVSGTPPLASTPLSLDLAPRGPTASPRRFRFEIDGLKSDRIRTALLALKRGGHIEVEVNRYKLRWSLDANPASRDTLKMLHNSDAISAALFSLRKESVRLIHTGETGHIETDLIAHEPGMDDEHYLKAGKIPFTYTAKTDDGLNVSYGRGFLGSVYAQPTKNDLAGPAADLPRSGAWVVYREDREGTIDFYDGGALQKGDTLYVLFDSNANLRRKIFQYHLLDGVAFSTAKILPEKAQLWFESFSRSLRVLPGLRKNRWLARESSPRISLVLAALNGQSVEPASRPVESLKPGPALDWKGPGLEWKELQRWTDWRYIAKEGAVPFGEENCINIPKGAFVPGDVLEIPLAAWVDTHSVYREPLTRKHVLEMFGMDNTFESVTRADEIIERFKPTIFRREPFQGAWAPRVPAGVDVKLSLSIDGSKPDLIQNFLNRGDVISIPWYEAPANLEQRLLHSTLLEVSPALTQSLVGGGRVCLSVPKEAQFESWQGRWIADLRNVPDVWKKAPTPPGGGTIATAPSRPNPVWEDIVANKPIIQWHQADPARLVEFRIENSVLFAVGIRRTMSGRTVEFP